MSSTYPFFLAGRWEISSEPLPVVNPYDGSIVGVTYNATDRQIEDAMESAVAVFPRLRALPSYARADLLRGVRARILAARDDLARLITAESGKPIKDACAEVDRCLLTFETAAEEATRVLGEVLPLDVAPSGTCHLGITRRFPIGPVLAITPFNYPLNLPAHKVAPALAVGNPVVLKPASKTPLTWLKVAELCNEAGLPPGALSVLPTTTDRADRLVRDNRFKLVTFTGSAPVGWQIKERAGHKRVLLELGGNAGVIVDADADVPFAVARTVAGGFAYAGQLCVSVQRVYAQRAVFDEFARDLVNRVRKLKVGDPLDPETDVGPVISAEAVQRITRWIQEALTEGATLLTGGRVLGHNLIEPAVLMNVKPTSKISCGEAFAPLVSLCRFDDFDDAVQRLNQSPYGLQSAVFTRDLPHAFAAFEQIETGAVIVNDSPSFRVDPMPYGGMKESGMGREGLKYAIDEMTESRLLVVNRR
ncbi:MAG TPA: aldehyde dehydrogenase family protein [Solirubrobacteraceae bacterium]|nr:aldehyde dehydrogenase family protein [Solirubrobacteraceae bacterium]HVC32535.1 aldehyde dehydrogenase family protein [Chloroflexota bacterium]